MNKRRLTRIAAATAWLIAQTTFAAATHVAVITASDDGTAERDALALTEELAKLVKQAPDLAFEDVSQRFWKTDRERREAKAREGGEVLLPAALGALDKLDFDGARDKISKAITALEQSDLISSSAADQGKVQALDRILEAMTLKAQILELVGQERESRQLLERVFTLNQQYQLPEHQPSPRFKEWAQKAAEDVEKRIKTSLKVASAMPGRVFVDGVYRGISPLEVTGLHPGKHYVTVLVPGYPAVQGLGEAGSSAPFNAKLDKPSAEWTELQGKLKSLRAALQQKRPVSPKTDLARWLGVDEVFVGFLSRSGESLRVTTARIVGGKERTPATPEVIVAATTPPEQLAKSLFNLLTQPEPSTAPVESPPKAARPATVSLSSSGAASRLSFPGPRGEPAAVPISLGVIAVASLAGGIVMTVFSFNHAQMSQTGGAEQFERELTAARRASGFSIGLYLLSGVSSTASIGALLWNRRQSRPQVQIAPREGGALVVVGGGF